MSRSVTEPFQVLWFFGVHVAGVQVLETQLAPWLVQELDDVYEEFVQ